MSSYKVLQNLAKQIRIIYQIILESNFFLVRNFVKNSFNRIETNMDRWKKTCRVIRWLFLLRGWYEYIFDNNEIMMRQESGSSSLIFYSTEIKKFNWEFCLLFQAVGLHLLCLLFGQQQFDLGSDKCLHENGYMTWTRILDSLSCPNWACFCKLTSMTRIQLF